jgi:hypothetical protein
VRSGKFRSRETERESFLHWTITFHGGDSTLSDLWDLREGKYLRARSAWYELNTLIMIRFNICHVDFHQRPWISPPYNLIVATDLIMKPLRNPTLWTVSNVNPRKSDNSFECNHGSKEWRRRVKFQWLTRNRHPMQECHRSAVLR